MTGRIVQQPTLLELQVVPHAPEQKKRKEEICNAFGRRANGGGGGGASDWHSDCTRGRRKGCKVTMKASIVPCDRYYPCRKCSAPVCDTLPGPLHVIIQETNESRRSGAHN